MSFTGSQGILAPTLDPANHFLWYGVFTAALWGCVGIVALAASGRGRAPRDRSTG